VIAPAAALTLLSGAAGLFFVALAIFVVVELVKIKGQPAKCWLVKRAGAFWRTLRNLRGNKEEEPGDRGATRPEQRRKPGGSISRFPVSAVATVLLGVLAVFIGIYAGTLFRGPGTFGFSGSFDQNNPAVTGTNTAAPQVEAELTAYATLKPSGQKLSEAAVIISGPTTITLSDCHVQGQKAKSGFARGSQARVGLERISSTDLVNVECNITVVHRIRRLETVTLELAGADSADTKKAVLYLEPPNAEQGRETAEAEADQEVRMSPALWQKSSMVSTENGFREQGIEWPLLDPRLLHGFQSEPHGRTRALHQLESTRIEPSKILTLSAVITSAPITQERLKVKGSERQAIRQVFAVGENLGEQGGWCETTRSTDRPPLREGQRVKLRAAVVEWGRSEASGGIAVMLKCPAVKVQGASSATAKTESGAVPVPNRLSH
jgi:hypothetical protein